MASHSSNFTARSFRISISSYPHPIPYPPATHRNRIAGDRGFRPHPYRDRSSYYLDDCFFFFPRFDFFLLDVDFNFFRGIVFDDFAVA